MTILTHLDKLTNQAADRYTFYRVSNHALAAKFGEIAVRLWHKRMARLNEDVQDAIIKLEKDILGEEIAKKVGPATMQRNIENKLSMKKEIVDNKVVVTAVDPKNCWDTGLAMWICYNCNVTIREDDKPDKCPNCKNKDLHKRI